MDVPLDNLDLRSLASLRQAFREAPEPRLELLVGEHAGAFVGPWWLRRSAPIGMAVGRMGGWWGKRFEADGDGDGTLRGVNLVSRHGEILASVPITAAVEPSRVDGRPAIVVRYPSDGPFQWSRVRDEFRSLGDGVLLGLTFGIPLAPPGLPFLLSADQSGIGSEGPAGQ